MTIPSLEDISREEDTDKAASGPSPYAYHAYCQVYDAWLSPWRDRSFKMLEIGAHLGASARMWRRYFTHATIVSIDIDISKAVAPGTTLLKIDQTDQNALRHLSAVHGPFDLIVDDGSHQNAHVKASFDVLFPLLSPGGIYIVEDLHAMYSTAYGGSRNAAPFIEHVKGLLDEITWRGSSWSGNPSQARDQAPGYLARALEKIEVRKSIVAFWKSALPALFVASPPAPRARAPGRTAASRRRAA
jgi:hypothetical protein